MTTTPTPPAAPAPDEVRVSEVRGDRMCIHCGFNLHGQVITREPHYGLLIIRCPECARVASTQEYPVLGRWAKRWGFVLAGAYLLLAVGGLLLAGLGAGAFAIEAASQHRYVLCADIAAAHRVWFDQTKQADLLNRNHGTQPALAAATIAAVNQWGPFAAVDRDWWDSQGRAALTKARADRGRTFRSDDVAAYSFFGAAAFLGAGLFAVLLPGLRGLRLLLIPVIVAGLGYLLTLCIPNGGFVGPTGTWLPGFVSASTIADSMTPVQFPLLVLAAAAVLIAAGAFLGRSLARGLIRLLLPPRYAGAFAFLWEADGRIFRPGTSANHRP